MCTRTYAVTNMFYKPAHCTHALVCVCVQRTNYMKVDKIIDKCYLLTYAYNDIEHKHTKGFVIIWHQFWHIISVHSICVHTKTTIAWEWNRGRRIIVWQLCNQCSCWAKQLLNENFIGGWKIGVDVEFLKDLMWYVFYRTHFQEELYERTFVRNVWEQFLKSKRLYMASILRLYPKYENLCTRLFCPGNKPQRKWLAQKRNPNGNYVIVLCLIWFYFLFHGYWFPINKHCTVCGCRWMEVKSTPSLNTY